MARNSRKLHSSGGQHSASFSSTPYLPSALPVGWDEGLSVEEFTKVRDWLCEHATSDGLQANFATAALSSLEGLEDVLHIFGPAVWRPVLN